MNKKIICIVIISMFLLTSTNILAKDESTTWCETLSGEDQLSIDDLRAWWSLYKEEATITYTVKCNSGEYSKTPYRVKLYEDNETEPFFIDSWVTYIVGTCSTWKLNEKPGQITAIIETKDNPELFKQTIDVPIGLDVSGTVKENNIPVEKEYAIVELHSSNCESCRTDELGRYHICLWPLDLKPRSYPVTAYKFENTGITITRLTYEISPGDNLTNFDLNFNSAPSKPTCSYHKINNEITVSSTDPNDYKIRYGVSWDNDGNVDAWTDYYESGVETSISCIGHKGTVGVVASNQYNFISSWNPVEIKSKAKSCLTSEKLLELFPLLQKILQRLGQ